MSKAKPTFGDAMRTAAEPKAEAKIAPSRRGKKPVMLYLEPEQAKRLKVLAAENETTIQALGLEALDLLFARHQGK